MASVTATSADRVARRTREAVETMLAMVMMGEAA
jgi:hypothetical protein